MNSLELKIPPPIVMLATALVMWLFSVFLPGLTLPALHSVTGAAIIGLAGLSLSMAGIITFKRAQTTSDPRRPGSASTLVTSGIYRFTRNPSCLLSRLLFTSIDIKSSQKSDFSRKNSAPTSHLTGQKSGRGYSHVLQPRLRAGRSGYNTPDASS